MLFGVKMFKELDDYLGKSEPQLFEDLIVKGMAPFGKPKLPNIKGNQAAANAAPGAGAPGAQSGEVTKLILNGGAVPVIVPTINGPQEQQMAIENVTDAPFSTPSPIKPTLTFNKPNEDKKTSPQPQSSATPGPNSPAPTTSSPESTVNEQSAAASKPDGAKARPMVSTQPIRDKKDGQKLAQLDPTKSASIEYNHTPKSKWYEDKLQHGDDVSFQGYHPDPTIGLGPNGKGFTANGTVVAKNPEKKTVTVKKPNGDLVEFFYGDINHYERPDETGKVNKYKFSEGVHVPSVGAPTQEAQKIIPVDQQMQMKADQMKHRQNKLQLLAQHLKPADWIGYYAPDVKTGEYQMHYGHVVESAPPTPTVAGKDGKQAKAQGPNPNQKILVWDGEKSIPVPMGMVETFAREHPIHGELEHFGYDAKKGGMSKLDYAMGAEPPVKPSEYAKLPEDEQAVEEKPLKPDQIHPDIEPLEQFEEQKKEETAPEQPDNLDQYAHLKPEHFDSATMALDKINNYMKSNSDVPFKVLKARHDLHVGNNIDSASKIIHQFVDNNGAVDSIAPPKTMQDFEQLVGAKVSDPNFLTVAEQKLASDKPASEYLDRMQTNTIKTLQWLATKHGFKGLSDRLGKVDASKDNRELLDVYKAFLQRNVDLPVASAGKPLPPPFDIHTPTDEHIDMANHLEELRNHLQDKKLLTPSYEQRADTLAQHLETDPDSKWVNKTFNQMHRFANDTGVDDPMFQFDTLKEQYEKAGEIEDPEKRTEAQRVIEGVQSMSLDPAKAVKKLGKLMEESGIKVELPESEEEMPSKTAYAKLQSVKNGVAMHKQTKVLQNNIDQLGKEVDKYQEEKASVPSEEGTKGLQVPTSPAASGPATKDKALYFKVRDLRNTIVGAEKNLQKFYAGGGTSSEYIQDPAIKAMKHALKSAIDDYNLQGKKLADVDGKEFEPYVSKIEHPVDEQQVKAKEEHNKTVQDGVNHMADVAVKRFQQKRNNILENSQFYSPDIQSDIANINHAIQQSGKSGKYLDMGMAKTNFGLKLINAYHAFLAEKQEADEYYDNWSEKSLVKLIEAEKILARRDISIALRKSFYNDVNSNDLTRCTELLGAYFDEFIDSFMTTYKAIPVDVRKTGNRALLKGLIKDVIKNNEFSASTMQEDFTAPLTDDVIKSMGQKIATIATDFRMETKPMFVFDLNKSDTSSKSIHREPVIHNLSLIKSDKVSSAEQWVERLVYIENIMYKAGLFPYRTNANRFKKFVKDNDEVALKSFYNECVEQLNKSVVDEGL